MNKVSILAVMIVMTSFLSAQNVIYNNGSLITNPGANPGDPSWSVLQSPNAMYGSNNSKSVFYRVADDFTLTSGSWAVDSAVFFEYQTDAGTSVSTFTAFNIRIWKGIPGVAGSTVVWGDTTTNRLINSYWSGIYRSQVLNGAKNRPIMKNVCATPSLTLIAGENYWIDWQATGTQASGCWQPFITIPGQTITGNGKQFTSGVWTNVVDIVSGKLQGFPFILYGAINVGVGELSSDRGLSLYPNPVENELIITSEVSLKNIKITSTNGLGVFSENISGNQFRLNTSALKNGIYLIQIQSEKARTIRKFVVYK